MLEVTIKLFSVNLRFVRQGVYGLILGLVLFTIACAGSSPDVTGGTTNMIGEAATQPTFSPGMVAKSFLSDPSLKIGGKVGNQAPEFGGISAWINGGPFTMEDLRGKVILIDFWTYTCINCIRTFPFLKEWHLRYADEGLVIVGIHAPEFEFEKDYNNVVDAIQLNSLDWITAQDNEFITWRRYNNRFWPAKYLVDRNGVVRYTHWGEGGYAETEQMIRKLLVEADSTFIDKKLAPLDNYELDPRFLRIGDEVTRELYLGYTRGETDLVLGRGGYVQQAQYYENKNKASLFDITEAMLPHKVNIQGSWIVGPESITHGRTTDLFEDHLTVVYSGTSVNGVLTSDSGNPYKVRITQGGKYLTKKNKGNDIIIGDDGESFLWVTAPTLYNVVINESYVRRETLTMSSNSPDFGLFAFTFGVYDTVP